MRAACAETIMAMSDDELRKLQELEAELSEQRRMVSLAQRLSSANVDTGLRRVVMLWVAGGSTGLSLAIAGAAVHRSAVLAAAVIVLAATLIAAGVASLAVEIAGFRRKPGHLQPA